MRSRCSALTAVKSSRPRSWPTPADHHKRAALPPGGAPAGHRAAVNARLLFAPCWDIIKPRFLAAVRPGVWAVFYPAIHQKGGSLRCRRIKTAKQAEQAPAASVRGGGCAGVFVDAAAQCSDACTSPMTLPSAYAFDTGLRLHSLPQLIKSLAYHYYEWSGRVVVKFLRRALRCCPSSSLTFATRRPT